MYSESPIKGFTNIGFLNQLKIKLILYLKVNKKILQLIRILFLILTFFAGINNFAVIAKNLSFLSYNDMWPGNNPINCIPSLIPCFDLDLTPVLLL